VSARQQGPHYHVGIVVPDIIGARAIELVQEVAGSIWVRNEYSNLHHIGFWSDDLGADGSELAGAGCPLQLCGRSADDAPVSFAYHRNELGVRIELVDATLRETMGFLFEPEHG
jgi:hypothetical protein